MNNNFFRYPGGKSKLKNTIIPFIHDKLLSIDTDNISYIEPFFGGGSIGLDILSFNFKSYHFNDFDICLYYLWKTVFSKNIDEFCMKVLAYRPKLEDFELFKNDLLTLNDTPENLAFKKLVIHQISYSGLGVKAGGPIGGKSQKSAYDISCRWNPESIVDKISRIHRHIDKQIIVSNYNFEDIDFGTNNFIYLDPPYYIKGNELYQHGLTDIQHHKLFEILNTTKNHWILSYDDNEFIRTLYKDYEIIDFNAKYSITENKEKITRIKKELLISNMK